MNKKHTRNLFAFALISFLSLSAMEEGESRTSVKRNEPDNSLTENEQSNKKGKIDERSTQKRQLESFLWKVIFHDSSTLACFLIARPDFNVNVPIPNIYSKEEKLVNDAFTYMLSERARMGAESKRTLPLTAAFYWECQQPESYSGFKKNKSSFEKIRMLLSRPGIEVDVPDENGCTLLMEVSTTNKKRISQWLLQKGANINGKDKDGNTPLMYSIDPDKASEKALYLTSSVTNVLLQNQANVNIANNKGETPLILLLKKLSEERVVIQEEYMKECVPVCRNFPLPDGDDCENCLDVAELRRGVSTLLVHGADVYQKDSDGKTAYDYAVVPDIQEVIRPFREAQAFTTEHSNLHSYLSLLPQKFTPVITQMIKLQGLEQQSNSNDNANDNSVEKLD